MGIALDGLREDNYRLGDLQALRYDPNKAPFHDGYLAQVYFQCKKSGILRVLFGENPPNTFDGIVSYLAARPVIGLGRWAIVEEEIRSFDLCGFAFPIVTIGNKSPELAMFAGYGFFKRVWGTEDQKILAMLGLAYLFNEFEVKAIHGTRFEDNVLTARFMEKFGFKTIGTIPNYQIRDGVLCSAVVSSCDRDDFERILERELVSLFRPEEAIPEAPQVPVENEKKEEPVTHPYQPLNWL